MIIAFVIEVDRQVDPITCWCDFKLAIVTDVCPVVAEEHFDYIAVPETNALFAVVSGKEQIQVRVRAFEEQIEIVISPEGSDGTLAIRIIDVATAILRHRLDRCVLPKAAARVQRKVWASVHMVDGEAGHRLGGGAGRLIF